MDQTVFVIVIQACLGGIAGSVPDHGHKASVTVKQRVTFLLVESLAFKSVKTLKCNK